MIDAGHAALMAEYNGWMNSRLYALCETMGDAARRADRGAFFGSIHGALNHLLCIDLIFMHRFTGEPATAPGLTDELFADFAAMAQARTALDARIAAWAATIEPDWLAGELSFTSVVDGRTRSLPRWVMVTQMFNHQTHHRGQVTTLLTQAGHDIGITDIPFMDRFTAAGTP